MSEIDWLATRRVDPLLLQVRGKVSERKLRLAACVFCRMVWDLLVDRRSRAVVDVIEKSPTSREPATSDAANAAAAELNQETTPAVPRMFREAARAAACVAQRASVFGYSSQGEMAAQNTADLAAAAVKFAARARHAAGRPSAKRHRRAQADMLRDIVGNPYRPVCINPAWLAWCDRTVPKLAEAAYDKRELPSGHLERDRLTILADAVEDAGCADEAILSHLRGPGPHVRGCWAVDLLLGKE